MAKANHRPRGPTGSEEEMRELALLADLAAPLSDVEDQETLKRKVLEGALEIFRCESGAVALWEEEGRLPKGPAVGAVGPSAGRAEHLTPEDLLSAEPVLQVVLREGRPLVLDDPGLTLGPALDGWRGLAVAPIARGTRPLGFLLVGDRRGDEPFTQRDVALLALVGNIVASALESRQAFTRFRDEMTRRIAEATAELNRAGAELRRIKRFNQDLFDSAPAGIIVFDRDFRVVFRNVAAERLWPDNRSVLSAAQRTDLVRRDPDWQVAFGEVVNMRRFYRAEDVTFEAAGREPIRVNITCSPLFTGNREVVGGVLIVEDVTQRVQMEKRLAVSERLAGVGRLAAMVAHEINNPLDGIIRLVNLARRVAGGSGEAAVEKYLGEADKGLMRLVVIVRDLLSFSRDAGRAVAPMPIQDVLTEAAETVRPAAEKAGVEIAVACDPSVPALKSGMLYHVVLNLVKNAVEAMPDGGRVEVHARAEPDALVLEVADAGPGIPAESLPRLFEPFFSRKAGGKGTGLGLIICKDLVEKQGGTIEASNRPEGGAVFVVRIPLVSGAAGGKT